MQYAFIRERRKCVIKFMSRKYVTFTCPVARPWNLSLVQSIMLYEKNLWYGKHTSERSMVTIHSLIRSRYANDFAKAFDKVRDSFRVSQGPL